MHALNHEKTIMLLPHSISKNIKSINAEFQHKYLSDILSVTFKNGHMCSLRIPDKNWLNGNWEPSEEALKEFQAKCSMVHDL